MMSEFSEDSYCAGWLTGAEYIIPALCRRAVKENRPHYWGFGRLEPARAAMMLTIAERLGHWANLGKRVRYVPFNPWPTPRSYAAQLKRSRKPPRLNMSFLKRLARRMPKEKVRRSRSFDKETGKTIAYRPPVEKDLKGMFGLWYEMQKEHEGYDKVWYGLKPKAECREDVLPRYRAKLKDPNAVVFVAAVDGKPVGMLIGAVIDRPKLLNQFKVLAIDTVVTAAKWQRKGIFRKLMDMATEEARARDVGAIDLKYIDASNPARQAYEKLGFKCHEVAMLKYL